MWGSEVLRGPWCAAGLWHLQSLGTGSGPIQIPLPLQKNTSLPSDAPNGRTHRNVPWQEAGKEGAGLVLRTCKVPLGWDGSSMLSVLGLCWHQILLPWVQGGTS